MSKQRKPKKPINADINVDGNHLHIDKDDNAVNVKYDGKNRDIEFAKNDQEKSFKYDGKKLDIEIEKSKEGTNVKVEASNGILKTLAKIVTGIVLKRFKR
jgi:hypothetical protein